MSWFRTAWRSLFAAGPEPGLVKRFLPRRLFARSLLIVVMPMVLLQAVVTYMFLQRNEATITARMSRAVASDVALIVKMYDLIQGRIAADELIKITSRTVGLSVAFLPAETLPASGVEPESAPGEFLAADLPARLQKPVWVDDSRISDYVDIRVAVEGGVLRILADQKRVTVTNSHVFVVWMLAFSFVLLGIAILFLRNQVRPIQRLAIAAESFGKGRDVPDFRPSGATEVRAAAIAFLEMKERIARQIQQRTEMLAGVSHDLRTPLTRMKLALAIMDAGPDVDALKGDVLEMEHMLEEYLAFARGQSGEVPVETDLNELIAEIAETARRHARDGVAVDLGVNTMGDLHVKVRRNALRRAIGNLVENALKYGKRAVLTARRSAGMVEISVEDDGPGIPPERREEAFRPFHRLDQGRNLEAGGVGLGLAIARDIARGHGGDIVLETSPMGGLKAELRLPV